MTAFDAHDAALLALLRALSARGYDFVTPTPLSHARVLAKPHAGAPDLRDIFGWNRPFAAGDLPPELHDLMRRADALENRGNLLASRYRVARCAGRLFLHSAFPTLAADSVFFGPDSYRFARWIKTEAKALQGFSAIIDLGAGAGVGALTVAQLFPEAQVRLVDLNTEALRLARINAAAAGVAAGIEEVPATETAWTSPALVIANPPYMADDQGRLYRDGGGMRGAAVSLAWARAVVARLRPGDVLLLYTGVAIVAGDDPLRMALQEVAQATGVTLRYDEIDPDVWGEELSRADFNDVDRIAVVGAVMQRL